MAETNMTLKQSYNSSGEKIYPLVSVDGIIDAYGIDDPNHRGKNLIALSLQGLDINPKRVDSNILTVAEDGGELTVKDSRIDIKGFPVHANNGLQVVGNIHSNSISVSKDVSTDDPIEYGTLEFSDGNLTNGAKLTLMKKGNGNKPESFFSVDNGSLKYYDVTITSNRFDFFNGVLKGDSTTKTLSTNSRFQVLNGSDALLDVSSNRVSINKDTSILCKLTVGGATTLKSTLTTEGKLTVGSRLNTVGSNIYGEFQVLNGSDALLDVSSNRVSINKDTSILGKLTVDGSTTIKSTLTTEGNLTVDGSTTIKSTLTTEGNLTVDGSTTLNSTLNVTGQTILARGYDKGIVINTSNDSSYGKKVIWADDEILRIKSHAKLDKGKTVGVQLLVGGDVDNDGYTASRVGIELSSSRSSTDVWTDKITMKPAVEIDGSLTVDESIIIGDLHNVLGDDNKFGFMLKSSSDSFMDKYIYCGEKGQILRLRTDRSSNCNNSIQLLAGGKGYGSAGAAIQVQCGKNGDTLSDEVRIKPRLIVDGTFLKHQIIGDASTKLPVDRSIITIESNFISIWGIIESDRTLYFKLPYKTSGDAFTGFFFMGIKKSNKSTGGKLNIIFQNSSGTETSICSEEANTENIERHLFFIPGWDVAHMIY